MEDEGAPGGLAGAVAALGGPPATAELLAGALPDAPAGAVPARVARVERGRALVLAVGCPTRARPVQPAGSLAVGDWCVVAGLRDGGPGTVAAVVPRRTALTRAAAGAASTRQVLAADVDVVAVLGALDRRLPARGLERMLALAWSGGARPVVVLSRADLVGTGERADSVLAVRRAAPGAGILVVSARTGEGVDDVRALVPAGTTLALLGSSGAGKSTLANVLLGHGTAAHLRTGAVRDGDARGRHTTTWRELVAVPGGGALVDTPGLRSIGMPAGGAGVDAVYADVAELVGTCRFADCGHDGEPGCAVAAAVGAGELAPDRLAGWRTLQREASRQAGRTDARLRADARRIWKQRSRDARARGHPRA